MDKLQTFFQTITTMRLSDYVDIALVAFILYLLMPLLRTASTMRIARSVAVLLLVAWLTNEMELYAISFILNQFLQVGLLAFVILFQPELRRMLDRLGNVRLRSFFGMEKATQEIDTILSQTVMACEIMSREKVGALIVFAREARLDEYMRTGTQIEGQVSEQLIRNIFFSKASLHDGAMIIRDGRISAAGCVLPLSESHRLSADLGTRHRAGVGISEVSDAVVIIVSEETGTISVAVGGMLKRHLAAKTLEKLLRSELSPASDEEEQSLTLRLKQLLKKKEGDRNER